jgi:PAS domain S-box-containing protein
MVDRIKSFLAPPTFANEEENRIAGILNAILLTLLTAGIVMTMIMALFGERITTITLFIAVSGLFICYGVMRHGHLQITGILVLLVLIIMVVAILLAGTGVHDPAILLLPIIIIIAGLILDSRMFAVITSIVVLSIGLVILLEVNGYVERAVFTRDSKALEFAIFAVILTITAVTIRLLTQNLKDNLARAQKSEAQWRSLVKNAPEMITYLQRDGTIDFLNTIMDMPDANVIGRTVYDFTHPDYHDALRTVIEQVLTTGESASCETIGIRRSGVQDWFDNRLGPVKQHGEIVGLTMISTNITERREMEIVLESEREFAQHIIDNMGQGLAITDENTRFVYANPAFTQMTGYTVDFLIGKTPFDLVSPAMYAQLEQQHSLRRSGKTSSYTSEIRHMDGHILHVLITGVPYWQDDKFIGSIAVVTDLTEQTETEIERERLISKLEMQNAELEQFTYTVSHDLKSPLITIQGFLGFLQQDLLQGDEEGIQTAMRHISRAVQRMEVLLRDLLELSRIGRVINPPEETLFADIVQESLMILSGQMEAQNVKAVVANNLPLVYVDKPRIVEVMQNLLENAIKFTRNQSSPTVEIGTEQRNEDTLFFVKDNGVGIDSKYQEKIFGLFERLDTSVEGTGIGLALVRRIIEVHNGRLWVESAGIGQGATFYFTLPLVEKY